MQHLKGIRRAVTTVAVVSAALAVAACQPGGGTAGAGKEGATAAGAPSKAEGGTAPASSPAPAAASSAPAAKTSSGAGRATASPVTASSGTAAAGCAASALKVSAHEAAVRPDGTGTGAAVVGFRNVSGTSCVLRGHPTVAGAGNGSPGKNRPLTVTPSGTASPVTLAPGGSAWVKLTFVQVQGEGDGYCESGADPSSYPTIVVGLAGAGEHQVALDDGVFAECDDTVTATAVSAAEPS